MLHKVLKHRKKQEKKSEDSPATPYVPQNNTQLHNTGFHAKKNSEAGAARQRSMGNRNTKPSR